MSGQQARTAPVEVPGYQLLRPLASGASATVYVAYQESLAREVALKILAPGLFDAQETRQRFLREARIQARLTHPSLLALLDAGFVGDRPFLVTEVVEGGSLRDVMDRARGPMPVLEAVRIAGEIAAGLAHAHEQQIVHRDLKPENVLMTSDGTAKVADFGLARVASEAPSTAAGIVLGTPGFVAPEVLDGEPATAAADVYALGAVLYELLTGASPFPAEEVGERLRLQSRGEFAEPGRLRAGLPAELENLVVQCLGREPGGRPPAAEFGRRLEALRSALSEQPEVRTVALSRDRLPAAQPRRVTMASASRIPSAGKGATVAARRPSMAMVAAAPPARGWHAGAVVLTAFLLVAAAVTGAYLWRSSSPGSTPGETGARSPAKSETGKAATGVPASSATTVALSVVKGISTGTDRARIWFTRPLSEELEATIEPPGASGPARRTIPPGSLHYEILGLARQSSFKLRLSHGAAHETHELRTMASDQYGQPFLSIHKVGPQTVELKSRAERVLATWRSQIPRFSLDASDGQVFFRESPDAGRTWFPLEELSPRADRTSYPSLLCTTAGELAVFAVEPGPGQAETRVRFRPAGSLGWETPTTFASEGDEPALVGGTGGQVELIAWVRSKVGNSGAVSRVPCDATGRIRGVASPPLPLQHVHADVRCCRALQAGNRLLVFYQDERPGTGHNSLGWIWSEDPARAVWTRPHWLTGEDERVGPTLELAMLGETILLVYEADFRVRMRRSTDGGQSFSERLRLPEQLVTEEANGTLATQGPWFFVGYSELTPMTRRQVMRDAIVRTRDGLSPEPVFSAPHMGRGARKLQLTMCGERPVLLMVDLSDRLVQLEGLQPAGPAR